MKALAISVVDVNNMSVFDQLAGPESISGTLIDAATAARAIARDTSGARGNNADTHVEDGAGISDSAFTHSWLFTGPPGSGRSVAARAFAAALVCSDPDIVGCGRCEHCRSVLSDSHGDVVYIQPHELSIGIDLMRTVVDDAAKLPKVSNWRVIILENADRLTESAGNALLKTVEEPPERTVIILCAPSTDPEDIMVTLRSRCRHIYIPTPTVDEVARILVREGGVAENDARLAAAASSGHIGRARHLAHNQQAQIRRANIINLAELIYHGDQAFQAVNSLVKGIEKESQDSLTATEEQEMEKLHTALGMGSRGKGMQKALRGVSGQIKDLEETQKKRRTRFLRDALDLALIDLAGIYRDALVLSSGAAVGLTHPDMEGLSRELAEKVTGEGLLDCLDAINKCREYFGYNVRPVVAMDALVGRLRKAYKVR